VWDKGWCVGRREIKRTGKILKQGRYITAGQWSSKERQRLLLLS
jgi:hypothetical protein